MIVAVAISAEGVRALRAQGYEVIDHRPGQLETLEPMRAALQGQARLACPACLATLVGRPDFVEVCPGVFQSA